MGLTPAPPPPPSPYAPWGKLQSTYISTQLPPPFTPSPSSFASPVRYQRTGDRLSEMFLLIPISFIITSFHVSGWLGPAGEGSGNCSGVPGINPTRCHWMACLPQWLMNGLLVSHYPHPLLFYSERSVPLNQFAEQWQVWTTSGLRGQPVQSGPSPLTEPTHLLAMLS